MQEGICKNCGSIVFIEKNSEKVHCLFCNCVFPSKEALEIAKNPSAYTFPNEEQPEYIDEKLQTQRVNSLKKLEETQKKNEAKIKKKPQYTIKSKELPNVNLSLKQITTLVLGFLVIIGIFLGFTLPKTLNRDKNREEIVAQFKEAITASDLKSAIDFDKGFVISNMDNSHLDLIITEKPSKEQAADIFELYGASRSKVLNDDLSDEAYKNISLRIAVPEEGGYLIKDQGLSDLENLDNIVELP